MLDYYTVSSLGGNGRKVSIMLAETQLPHRVHFLDLEQGDQHTNRFRAINPNGKIPAIVDPEVPGGLRIGESGAILVHLAEKTGRYLPTDPASRARVLMWTFWQVGGIGPMFGQWSYFARNAPERVPFAIERYKAECARLMDVLNQNLGESEYVAGDYSIADMAILSWAKPGLTGLRQEPARADDWQNVARWITLMEAHPAVNLAMTRPEGAATEAVPFATAADAATGR